MSPPVHVYAGAPAAPAMPTVPSNATTTAAPNKIRNLISAPFLLYAAVGGTTDPASRVDPSAWHADQSQRLRRQRGLWLLWPAPPSEPQAEAADAAATAVAPRGFATTGVERRIPLSSPLFPCGVTESGEMRISCQRPTRIDRCEKPAQPSAGSRQGDEKHRSLQLRWSVFRAAGQNSVATSRNRSHTSICDRRA